MPVVASVVVEAQNFVLNPGFENTDMSAWRLTLPAARQETADAFAGEDAATFWGGWAYQTSASQTLTGVPAGSHTLQAMTQGTNSPSTDTRMLTATTSEGSWSVPLKFTTWNNFDSATPPGVIVGTDGNVEISASFSLSAGAWGVLDDVRLAVPTTAEPVDKVALTAAVTSAKAIDHSPYTAASIAAL